jgi:hypothetical protein
MPVCKFTTPRLIAVGFRVQSAACAMNATESRPDVVN